MVRTQKLTALLSMILISSIMLFSFSLYQNQVPDLADIASFDPSHYDFTYSLQEFKLKPHDRQWTLASVTEFNADGEIQWERIYHVDEDGQAYYINGSERQDVSRYPRRGLQDITAHIANWDLSREEFDNAGRVIYREGTYPSNTGHHEIAEWYYCPNTETADHSNIAVFTRTIHDVSPDGEVPVCYGANDEPLMEFNTYEITNYDCYGNETRIWKDGYCFLKTDADGYLQMIISNYPGTYNVLRVDGSGKPLWSATYDKENLSLMEYIVYRYEQQRTIS